MRYHISGFSLGLSVLAARLASVCVCEESHKESSSIKKRAFIAACVVRCYVATTGIRLCSDQVEVW